jgi:hypothetical protein
MSEAALTFQIFGRSCVVILPPSLDVPPANDVDVAEIRVAQRAHAAQSPPVQESSVLARTADGNNAPPPPPPRPSEITLRPFLRPRVP